jgi:hypothetical protein
MSPISKIPESRTLWNSVTCARASFIGPSFRSIGESAVIRAACGERKARRADYPRLSFARAARNRTRRRT